MILTSEEVDGCLRVATKGILSEAAELSSTKGNRGGFPRYTVKVDGEHLTFSRADRLDRCLQGIRAGSTFRMFRNAGGGVTLDFDA